MKLKLNYTTTILTLILPIAIDAQVGINTDSPKSLLDITSTNNTNPKPTDGILIPRINIFPTTNPNANQQGMLVYLVADAIFNAQTKTKGFYYWNNSTEDWISIIDTNTESKDWKTNGNTGTDETTQFIGTTDNKPLNFRINNEKAGSISIAPATNYEGGNTSFGYNTLNTNTTGVNLTAIGNLALPTNTTGVENTAVGSYALNKNSTGIDNTAIGHRALELNTTGNYNSVLGTYALSENTDGTYNSAIGHRALGHNITGRNNTALGYTSLARNLTGSRNVAVGSSAGYSSYESDDNVIIGYNSNFLNNTISSNNVSIGSTTLTQGNYNTLVGYYAQSVGDSNIRIGADTDISSIATLTGNNNIIIGNNIRNSTVSNSILIANDYTGTLTANSVRIGNTSVTQIGGQVSWTSSSDGRIKDNVQENVPGLNFIKELRPVTYNLNLEKQMKIENPERHYDKTINNELETIKQTGFIAQEVETAAKKIGYSFNGVNPPKNSNQIYTLSYGTFVVPLVKAVQEQQTEIELLKEENKKLEKRLIQLENLLNK